MINFKLLTILSLLQTIRIQFVNFFIFDETFQFLLRLIYFILAPEKKMIFYYNLLLLVFSIVNLLEIVLVFGIYTFEHLGNIMDGSYIFVRNYLLFIISIYNFL